MKQIPLTKGKFALVDDEDFERLNKLRWFYSDGGYAHTSVFMGKVEGKYKTNHIRMHRFINNTPDGFITDHINGDKLDNRKENLRTVNKSQNARNTGLRKGNKSGVKGCYWEERVKSWRLQIKVNLKNIHLGYFKDIEQARIARQEAEVRYAAV